MPPPPPLLGDARTGHPHAKCYAQGSQDCSDKISREHWISRDILEQLSAGGRVRIAGPKWLEGEERDLTPKALGANVLCQRHNTAASPLDNVAGAFFRTLAEYIQRHEDETDTAASDSTVALFSGPHLELYLLKVLLGGVAAGDLMNHDTGQPFMAVRADSQDLLSEVLFRGKPLPEGWGLWLGDAEPPEGRGPEGLVHLQALPGPGGDAQHLRIQFHMVSLWLSLGERSDHVRQRYRPGGVVLDHPDWQVQRLLGIAWPSGSHRQVIPYTKGAFYAGGKHHRVPPGGLPVTERPASATFRTP